MASAPMFSPSQQRQLLALRYWLLGRQWYQASDALDFALERHQGMRKDGVTAEVVHQIAIASHLRTLPSLREPETIVVVGLTHDMVEDTGVSVETLERRFGAVASDAVWRLSKVWPGGKRPEDDYWTGIAACPHASIVKGADRIHNVGSMAGVFTLEKQREYLTEVDVRVLPMLKIARRKFPDQEPAYESILTVLRHQVALFRALVPELARP